MYNPKSKTGSKGFLETRIRHQRSKTVIYETDKGEYKKKKIDEIVIEGEKVENDTEEETILLLKQKVVRTTADRDGISNRMSLIHVNRFIWIRNDAPSLTEILSKYPRYIDCVEIVSKSFPFFFILHTNNENQLKHLGK